MPPEPAFSFETLSKQEAQERKSPRLTKIGPTFWDELWTYLDALETAYLKAHADQPTGRKAVLLSDELRNAMRKAEALSEARQRKITHHAMKDARQETPAPPENLTRLEAPLFAALVAAFQAHHRAVAPPAGRRHAAQTPAVPPPPATAATKTTPSAAATPPPAPPAAAQGPDDLATVRALVDIPPFVGLDAKTYRLKKGEVATIPRKMAEILKKNGKVAPVA